MNVFEQLLKNKLAIVLLVIVIILAGVTGFLATGRSANLAIIAEQQGVITEQQGVITEQQAELNMLKEELAEKASEIADLQAEVSSLRKTTALTFTPGLKVYDVAADISGHDVVFGRVQNTGDYYLETVKIIVVSFIFDGRVEDCVVATVRGLYPGEDAYWQTPRMAGVGSYREVYAIGDQKVEE